MLSRVGGRYRVYSEGRMFEATLRGRFKRGARTRVLVGDHVLIEVHADGAATLEEVLPRKSVLRRRTPGKRRGVRAVAANLNQVVVVGAVSEPDWDSHLIDRFVAVAEANDLPCTLVVNKCDLSAIAAELAEPYECAGYPVLLTSVPLSIGIADLSARLERRVSLLAGPTGVGKSSLLNALQPGLRLRTAAVSRKTKVGRHTTVSAEMYPLSTGGFVVDTPGLRDVGLWGIEPADVAAAFPDFAPYAGACKYDNCRHLEEPECAVRAAAEDGRLAQARLRSYRCLLREAVQASRTWD